MPAVEIEWSDVRRRLPKIKEDRANELIIGTLALARMIAPCIDSPTLTQNHCDAARTILLNAIERQGANSPGIVRESKTVGGVMHSKEMDRYSRDAFTTQEARTLQSMCPDNADIPNTGPQGGFPPPMFTEDTTVIGNG